MHVFTRLGGLTVMMALLIAAVAIGGGPSTTVVAQVHEDPTVTPAHDATATPVHDATATATPGHDATATATPGHDATATATPGHDATPTATATPVHAAGCTYTQGYYKNHGSDLLPNTMQLGSVTYSRAQLLTILNTPVKGNGAIALAYQLIAAQANIGGGASAPASVQTAIQQANALLTGNLLTGFSLDSSATSDLTSILDQYNNGLAASGPAHC